MSPVLRSALAVSVVYTLDRLLRWPTVKNLKNVSGNNYRHGELDYIIRKGTAQQRMLIDCVLEMLTHSIASAAERASRYEIMCDGRQRRLRLVPPNR